MDNINTISRVLITGIVVNDSLQSDFLNIKRPTFEIETFNDVQNTWVRDIYLVFTDNGDARRSRGISNGCVLCVEGELVFFSQEGKFVIFVSGYSMCQKAKDLSVARTMVAESIGFLNSVSIIGNVLCSDKKTITVKHAIVGDYRGDLTKTSVQPLTVAQSIEPETEKIVFSGKFFNRKKTTLEGQAYEIS